MSIGCRTVTVGGLNVRYCRPAASSPVAGVVVLHELVGLSAGVLDVVERLADEGYTVAAPDLYSGRPRPVCIARTLIDAALGSRGSTQTRIAEVRTWLVSELGGPGGARVGVLGFCMGGGFALMAASHQGQYHAASVNYGPVPRARRRIQEVCPVVASYGERDLLYGPQGARLDRFLKELTNERGLDADFRSYPSSGHSFITRPRRPRRLPPMPPLYAGYNEADAADAWGRILRFFERHLH